MRILVITEYYPSTFKPYYDTQFAQFLRDGHELQIFAVNRQGAVLNEPVVQYGLEQRTHYFPERLFRSPRFLPSTMRRLASDPAAGLRRLAETRSVPRWKDRMTHGIRMLRLPAEQPDLCLVHGLTAAAMVPWLRDLYPDARVAMYYHGGETPLSHSLRAESVHAAFAGADLVFTNTRSSADHAISRGCDPDGIRILPVGFSLDDYRPPDRRSYRRGGVLRLLSASRLSEEKGHLHALAALHQLVSSGVTDVRYTIVGNGHTRAELEHYVAESGLERHVEFAGLVSTGDLISRIGEADVVLLPSIQIGNWVENQACIVQEAMLMKALVIASATGGVPESTAPELQRFIVPPKDPSAIVKAILEVRALGNADLVDMGEAGRRFAEEHYDIRLLNRELLRLSVTG